MDSHTQVLEVWGDFACYSRPELKVERFSYPLPPPSAVRGIFEAVYTKPKEFRALRRNLTRYRFDGRPKGVRFSADCAG